MTKLKDIIEQKQKPINLRDFYIKRYDFDTFLAISKSTDFVNHFKNKKWLTPSQQKLAKNVDGFKIKSGPISFVTENENRGLEFYNSRNLTNKIKERVEYFEQIDWKIFNHHTYQLARQLYRWEIWLEEIKWIEDIFKQEGLL